MSSPQHQQQQPEVEVEQQQKLQQPEMSKSPVPSTTPTQDPRLRKLLSNPQLLELLRDPQVQLNLSFLYDDELLAATKNEYSNNHNRRNNNYRGRGNSGFPSSAGFPNPNNQKITPLEAKLIEGGESKEQEALRLLLKQVMDDRAAN